jgi:hypothetical protein
VINEWTQQSSNEPNESCEPAKALPIVIVSKADQPNVGDIFPLAMLRTASEMYVVANLVE